MSTESDGPALDRGRPYPASCSAHALLVGRAAAAARPGGRCRAWTWHRDTSRCWPTWSTTVPPASTTWPPGWRWPPRPSASWSASCSSGRASCSAPLTPPTDAAASSPSPRLPHRSGVALGSASAWESVDARSGSRGTRHGHRRAARLRIRPGGRGNQHRLAAWARRGSTAAHAQPRPERAGPQAGTPRAPARPRPGGSHAWAFSNLAPARATATTCRDVDGAPAAWADSMSLYAGAHAEIVGVTTK